MLCMAQRLNTAATRFIALLKALSSDKRGSRPQERRTERYSAGLANVLTMQGKIVPIGTG